MQATCLHIWQPRTLTGWSYEGFNSSECPKRGLNGSQNTVLSPLSLAAVVYGKDAAIYTPENCCVLYWEELLYVTVSMLLGMCSNAPLIFVSLYRCLLCGQKLLKCVRAFVPVCMNVCVCLCVCMHVYGCVYPCECVCVYMDVWM